MWNICEITINHIYPWCEDHYFWNWHELTIHKWSEIGIYEVDLKWTSHISPTNGIQPCIKKKTRKKLLDLEIFIGKNTWHRWHPPWESWPSTCGLTPTRTTSVPVFPIWSLCFWGTQVTQDLWFCHRTSRKDWSNPGFLSLHLVADHFKDTQKISQWFRRRPCTWFHGKECQFK